MDDLEGVADLLTRGFPETRVTYHYKMQNVPVWAKSPDVLSAFPEMASKTSGNASDKITLAQTLAGWQVPANLTT